MTNATLSPAHNTSCGGEFYCKGCGASVHNIGKNDLCLSCRKLAHTSARKRTDRDRLYETLDRNNAVKIRVPFNPMLLALLGQFNALKTEDRPELADVEQIRNMLPPGLLLSEEAKGE